MEKHKIKLDAEPKQLRECTDIFSAYFKLLLIFIFIFITSSRVIASTDVTIDDIKAAYNNKQYYSTIYLTQKYLKAYPHDPDGWILQGYANYNIKNYSAALNSFESAILIDNYYAEAWDALAQVYYTQKGYNKALEAINDGLKVLPNNQKLLLKKTSILLALNEINLAINNTQQLLSKNPHNKAIQQLLQKLYTVKSEGAITPGKVNIVAIYSAIVYAQEIFYNYPFPIHTSMLLNTPIMTSYKTAGSILAANHILGNMNKIILSYKTILALYKANQLTQAQTAAELYLSYFPNDSDVHFLLGKIYQQQHNTELAQQQFNIILRTHPNYPGLDLQIKQLFPYSYNSILALYKANKLNAAEADAIIYIKKYPRNPDVIFLLGQIYQKQQQYRLAKQQYEIVLKNYPNYPDALDAVLEMRFATKDYYGVIQLATAHLNNAKIHDHLLYDIANSLYALRDYQQALATIRLIPNYQHDEEASALYAEINSETNYHYISHLVMGTSSSLIEVKNPNQAWTLSSIYTQYNTPKGNIGVLVSYQTRPSLDAPQVGVYAEPQFTTSNYAHISYAHANNPNLFANQEITFEDYQNLPFSFLISAGDKYRKLPATYLNAYTGTIAKYSNNYYLEFRPTYFVPAAGPTSLLYTLTFKKYYNAVEYIGFVIAEGTSPDLANLNTVNFLKTDAQVYMFTAQHEINKQFAMQYGIGEEIENFGNQNLRRYTYLNFGLNFRDV